MSGVESSPQINLWRVAIRFALLNFFHVGNVRGNRPEHARYAPRPHGPPLFEWVAVARCGNHVPVAHLQLINGRLSTGDSHAHVVICQSPLLPKSLGSAEIRRLQNRPTVRTARNRKHQDESECTTTPRGHGKQDPGGFLPLGQNSSCRGFCGLLSHCMRNCIMSLIFL